MAVSYTHLFPVPMEGRLLTYQDLAYLTFPIEPDFISSIALITLGKERQMCIRDRFVSLSTAVFPSDFWATADHEAGEI